MGRSRRRLWAYCAAALWVVQADEGLPSALPTGLPSPLPTGLPSAMPTGLPSASSGPTSAEVSYDGDTATPTQEGEAEEEESDLPSLPEGFISDPPGSSVSAGHYHTCALRYTPGAEFGGSAQCWGMDEFRQCSGAPLDTFVQLSSGHMHTCGLTIAETVACWGEDREQPYRPAGLFQQVSAGQFHTCGLTKDGAARCWGQDHNTGSTKAPPGRFVQIGAGDGFSCGVRLNGLVECWGKPQRKEKPPPSGTRVAQLAVSTSSRHGCGLTYGKSDLVCWGLNTKGEAPDFLEGPFAQVAVGYRTTCVISLNGTNVDCFGLAARHFNTRDKFAASRFGTDRIWDEVTVGRDHICVVDSEGELFCGGQPLIDARNVPQGFVVA